MTGFPRRSPTIVPSVAIGQSSLGPVQSAQDAAPVWHFWGTPGLFRWALGSGITDDDGATCVETSGGQVGRFLRERCPDRGDDLTDAAATIRPSGKRWRVLPAATLTANRILTLGVATATISVESGDWILVTREDVTSYSLTIANGGAGGGNVSLLPGGGKGWVLAYFDGTNWIHKASGSSAGTSGTIYSASQTFLHTDLTDSTTSKTINLFAALPASAVLLTRQITLITPFVAVGMSRLELVIGLAGGFEIMTAFRCEQAAQVVKGTDGANPQGVYGGQQLTAKFTPTGALLSALTAGSVTVFSTYFVPVSA